MAASAIAFTEAGLSYGASCEKYEALAEKKLTSSDVICIAGFGCCLNVKNDALIVKGGFTHAEGKPVTYTLFRGVHGVSSIVILADSGNITLDAIRFCNEQDICVMVIDRNGNLTNSITSEPQTNAALRRKQYTLDDSQLAKLCFLVVSRKIKAQYAFLCQHPELPQQKRALEIFETQLKWMELQDLTRWSELNYLRTFEARLSDAFFAAMEGFSLKWAKADAKRIPPHWLVTGKRGSPLSHNHGGRNAVDPVNCIRNYAYALLEAQCKQALALQGFDISCGLLHADKQGRDSLVYDLMEEYRAGVEKLIFTFVNKTTFKKGDFSMTTMGNCRLSPELARLVVASCKLEQKAIEEGAKWLKMSLQSID